MGWEANRVAAGISLLMIRLAVAQVTNTPAVLFNNQGYVKRNLEVCTTLLPKTEMNEVASQWNSIKNSLKGKSESELTVAEHDDFDRRVYGLLNDCDARVVRSRVELEPPGPAGVAPKDSGTSLFEGLRFIIGDKGSKISVAARAIEKKATASPDMQNAFGPNTPKVVHDVAMKAAREILAATNYNVPGDWIGTKIAVPMFIKEAVRQNVLEFGFPATDSAGKPNPEIDYIVNRSTQALDACFSWVDKTYRRDVEKIKAAGDCQARFVASREYRVGEALLDLKVTQTMTGVVSDANLTKIKILARGELSRCAALRITPYSKSPDRLKGIQGCVYSSALVAYQLATREGLQKTIATLAAAPGSTSKFSPTEIGAIADHAQHAFLDKNDGVAQDLKCPAFRRDLLAQLPRGLGDTQFNGLAACPSSAFQTILSGWADDYKTAGGREVVRETLRSNAQVKTLLAGRSMPPDVEYKILLKGYDACIARQVKRGKSIEPSACENNIQAAAKLELGGWAIESSFQPRFDALAKTTKDPYLKAYITKLYSEANHLGHDGLDACTQETLPLLSLGRAEESQNRAISLCLQKMLTPMIERFVDAQVLAAVANKPMLAAYLPRKGDELLKKLQDLGVFRQTRVNAINCLTTGLNNYRIENLSDVLEAREPLCSQDIEMQASGLIARGVADGIAQSKFQSLAPADKESARLALLEVVGHYQNGEDVGGFNITREHQAIQNLVATNFGHTYKWANSSADETAAIAQVKQQALAERNKRAEGYALAQDHLQLNLTRAAAHESLAAQVGQQLADPGEKIDSLALAQGLNQSIDRRVSELKRSADQLHSASPDSPARQTLQKSFDQNNAQLTAAITDEATAKLLTYKVEDSLKKSVSPLVAQVGTQMVADQYRACMSKSKGSGQYNEQSVENCKNRAIAEGVWTAYKLTIDENVGDFFGAEFDRLKDKKFSEADCKKFSSPQGFSEVYSHHLCREPAFKMCITGAKANIVTSVATPVGIPARIDQCLSEYVVNAAQDFSPMAINNEMKKYFLLPETPALAAGAAPKPAEVWHGKMRTFGAQELERMDVEKRVSGCIANVRTDLHEGRITSDASTSVSQTNACISMQVFDSARRAGPFAYLQYLFFLHPELSQKSPKNIETLFATLASNPEKLGILDAKSLKPIRNYLLCLDNKERSLFGLTIRQSSSESLRQVLTRKNLKPSEIQSMVGDCSKAIEPEIREIVLTGLQNRGGSGSADAAGGISGESIHDIAVTFPRAQDQTAAYLRIKNGHELLRGIAAQIGDDPKKAGAHALPNVPEVSANFDLLSKLTTDACVFDSSCETQMRSLSAAVATKKNQNGFVDDKTFQNVLIDSPLFDRVILRSVQKQLRATLEDSLLKGTKGGQRVYVMEMINKVTSYDYLKSRFLDKNGVDMNGKPVVSGNYIIEYLRKMIREQIQDKGSFNDADPAFAAQASKLIGGYLADDWEFNASVFWAEAGQKVDTTDVPWAYYTFGIYKPRFSNWWQYVSKTPSGCSIIQGVQQIMKAQSAGSTAAFDTSKFEKLYRAGVQDITLAGAKNVDPSTCLPRHIPKIPTTQRSTGH